MGRERQAKRRRTHEAHDAEDQQRENINTPLLDARIGHRPLLLAFVANNLCNPHG
jgi:hypothetical protein